jgi:hypothetical protein
MLTAAVDASGCLAVGIDLDTSRTAVSDNPRIAVIQGDALEHDYRNATAVYLYLWPETLTKVLPLLPPEATVVSYMHEIPAAFKVGDFYVRNPRPILWNKQNKQRTQPPR